MSVRAIWRRLRNCKFSLESLKIKENDPEWHTGWDTFSTGEREKFVIWSSTSACQTLKEISVYNSYVCAPMGLFQTGPMRPLAILNFDRLKSIRIEMNATFWEIQLITICINYDDANPNWNLRPSWLDRRFSLIDNAPNLENLSIEYTFYTQFLGYKFTTFGLFREASLKRKLQLIIVYLGNHSI